MHLKKRFLALLLILTCVLGLSIKSASGRQAIESDDWPFGHEGFNLLIQETGISICSFGRWNSLPNDQKFMLMLDHPGWEPALRTVPSLITSTNRSASGLNFRPLTIRGEIDESNRLDFFQSVDCPIVHPEPTHPVFSGIDRIICNRPGFISRISTAFSIDDVQEYSITGRRGIPYRFSAIDEDQKFMAIADRNIFTNQMLFKGDNLLLAENILAWLSDDFRRKNVLLIVGGRVVPAIDESDLEIETPIPTREEVLAALKDLPADKMLEFANSIAAVVEDEQLLNDMAHQLTDKLPPKALNRILLLTLFATCCLFGVVTYFTQRKILRKTSSDVAAKRRRIFANKDSSAAGAERQAAASMILNAFCLDVANRRLADWAEFPSPLDSSDELVAKRATHEMADAFWSLKTKPNTYWTQDRLIELEGAANRWRELIQAMDEPIDATQVDTP